MHTSTRSDLRGDDVPPLSPVLLRLLRQHSRVQSAFWFHTVRIWQHDCAESAVRARFRHSCGTVPLRMALAPITETSARPTQHALQQPAIGHYSLIAGQLDRAATAVRALCTQRLSREVDRTLTCVSRAQMAVKQLAYGYTSVDAGKHDCATSPVRALAGTCAHSYVPAFPRRTRDH